MISQHVVEFTLEIHFKSCWSCHLVFCWPWMSCIVQWTKYFVSWFYGNRLDYEFDADHQGRCRSKIETAKSADCWNIDESDCEADWKWIFIWIHRADLEREPSVDQYSVLWGHKSKSKETGNMHLELCFDPVLVAMNMRDGQEKAAGTWKIVYGEIKGETMTTFLDPCTVLLIGTAKMTFWNPSAEFETNDVRVLIEIINTQWVRYKCLSTNCK